MELPNHDKETQTQSSMLPENEIKSHEIINYVEIELKEIQKKYDSVILPHKDLLE